MTITINTKAYKADRVNPDSIDFAGPAQTLTIKDSLQTKRIYPKKGGGTGGVARPACKMTKTVVVDVISGRTAEGHIRIEGSLPVGMSAVDIESLLSDAVAYAASTEGKNLFKTLALGD